MYGLQENIDLNFLKEKQLIQICVSLHQVILRFDDDISISVESVIKMFSGNDTVYQYDDNIQINEEFMKLLGKSIVNVTKDNKGTILLAFENGSSVEITDDSSNYESYQIIANGKTIVV